jgi:hypothetical protein
VPKTGVYCNPLIIDKVVYAKLPDLVVDPELSKIIRDYIVYIYSKGL